MEVWGKGCTAVTLMHSDPSVVEWREAGIHGTVTASKGLASAALFLKMIDTQGTYYLIRHTKTQSLGVPY